MNYELNVQQLEFVKSGLENSKLLGIPGGGKTTTIIFKIINLYEMNILTKKSEFIILTFSRKACEDFKNKANSIKPKLCSKNNCKTFHSLAGSIIQTINGKTCSSLQTTILSAINTLKKITPEALKDVKTFSNIKLLIVDEAQDMSDIQYELVKLFTNMLNATLILVGDPNQNIYQFQNGSDKYLMEYDGKTYYLVQNNRSTPEIVKFINNFRPWSHNLPEMVSARKSLYDGTDCIGLPNLPSLPTIFCDTHTNILYKIIETIKNSPYLKEDIAIIGPVKKSSSANDGAYMKFGLQAVANCLTKHNIPFIKHYNESTEEQEVVQIDLSEINRKGKVNLYTIHGSKGLEFKQVILLNFHTMTFGKNPTVKEYNEAKYLWYVGLSRAKNDLLICVVHNKNIWAEMLKCDKSLYRIEGGKPIVMKEPVFGLEKEKPDKISELLIDKTVFSEKDLLELEQQSFISENIEQLFQIDLKVEKYLYENKNISNYIPLFTTFLKNIYEYYYCFFKLDSYRYIDYIKDFIKAKIDIPNKYRLVLPNILAKLAVNAMDTIDVTLFKSIKDHLTKHEAKLYKYIIKILNRRKTDKFSIFLESNDIFMDTEYILSLCSKLNKCIDIELNMFKLTLFQYQYEHETKYLWTSQGEMFYEYLNVLEKTIDNIKILALSHSIENNYAFSINVPNRNIKIYDVVDIVDMNKGTKINIKFSENITTIHKLQSIITHYSAFPRDNNIHSEKIFEIWNFRTGTKHIYEIKPSFTSLDLLIKLSELTGKELLNIILVYDLETTGLDTEKCEIIERYMCEFNTLCTVSSGVIRPSGTVSNEILKLTGISKVEIDKGENVVKFIEDVKKIVALSKSPIFIAHNGNVFDHKILRRLGIITQKCKTLDSKIIINQFHDEKLYKMKLVDIYKYVVGHSFNGTAHRASADVEMMIDIFNSMNFKPATFTLFTVTQT